VDEMYGTVARMRVKPGMGERVRELTAEYDDLAIPGFVATYAFRLDADPNDYYLVVLFEDRDSYRRNAVAPEQDARYRKLRELLEGDPKWHDGEVVWTSRQG
jgi:quinol monooxygenase YgiN